MEGSQLSGWLLCVSLAHSSNAAYVVGEGSYYYASNQGCWARQTLLNSNSFVVVVVVTQEIKDSVQIPLLGCALSLQDSPS